MSGHFHSVFTVQNALADSDCSSEETMVGNHMANIALGNECVQV